MNRRITIIAIIAVILLTIALEFHHGSHQKRLIIAPNTIQSPQTVNVDPHFGFVLGKNVDPRMEVKGIKNIDPKFLVNVGQENTYKMTQL